ncbi:hypothetical protein B0J15DRAFT_449412 [Fusarium solani]|uniref:Chromo domain-containing protein n=1 Tax=Fusarium solani TaxID=169388 RepID=A0A9P9H0I6_FUSSL|nr:uncharacterized protein B0J15DRAFT_449412 [Fusarium solani]KAH7248138.1 hypothetical protein B0J15DRAFT_449412 [Fusarium solani]
METIMSLVSPRKQPSVEPPKPLRSKTYSPKDQLKAKRALGRISNTASRSPRTRTSNVSSITTAHDTTADITQGETSALNIHRTNPSIPTMSSPATQTSPATRPARASPALRTGTPRGNHGQKRPTRAPAKVEEAKDVGIADPRASPELGDDRSAIEPDNGEHAFNSIIAHRWNGTAFELRIDWEVGPKTWEPEVTLHQNAPDALFAYWRAKGGRPDNPLDADMYDVYAIRKLSKNKRKVLVEWVGYEEKDMTWEDRKEIEKTAKAKVDEFLASQKKKKKKKKK